MKTLSKTSLSEEELEILGISSNYRNESYKRLSWDEYFMSVVEIIRKRSHDADTQHGIVLVRDNKIISTGFNGYPENSEDNLLPNIRKDRKKYWAINHAEESAIFNAAKYGIALNGCKAYISGKPCNSCSKKLISVGVKHWIIGNITHISSLEEDLQSKYWIESHNILIEKFS